MFLSAVLSLLCVPLPPIVFWTYAQWPRCFSTRLTPITPLLRRQLEFGTVCDQTPVGFIFLAFTVLPLLDADVPAPEGNGGALERGAEYSSTFSSRA
jgi:hypothetical protein